MEGPSDDELVTAWGLALEGMARAGRRLGAELEEAVGLPPTSAEVLFRLLRTPGHQLPTTQLAREVSFSSGGFTKLADRLVDAGLVERRPSPTDRRLVFTALTAKGRAVARKAMAVHVDGLRRHVLAALGAGGVAQLAGLMRSLRDHHAAPPA